VPLSLTAGSAGAGRRVEVEVLVGEQLRQTF
jgi:hypothetical protein